MTIQKYAGDKITGLSTDTKPTNVLDGATFYATDTKEIFVKVGGVWGKWSSNWLKQQVTADAGSAHEIDWAYKNHRITLTENCSITFKDPIEDAKLTIIFYGEFNITLPAGTKQIVGTSLEMSGETMMVVTYDGTNHIVMSSDIEEIT